MLMQSPSLQKLELIIFDCCDCEVVASGIAGPNCSLGSLFLGIRDMSTSSSQERLCIVQFINALKVNRSLNRLELEGEIADLAGIALAEALKTNQTLREVKLTGNHQVSEEKEWYKTFSSVLKTNNFQVHLSFESIALYPSIQKYSENARYKRDFHIQQRLNQCGRGHLLTNDCTRADWLEALVEVNERESPWNRYSTEMVDWVNEVDSLQSEYLAWDCLYWFLRANPLVCVTSS